MPKDKTPKAAAEKKTVEALKLAHETPAWLFASAKMKHNWPVGAELTEDEYVAALTAAAEEPIGYVPPQPDESEAPAAEAPASEVTD